MEEVPVRVVVVPEPGRHARDGRPPALPSRWAAALVAAWAERVPEQLRGRIRLTSAHLGLVAFLVAGGLAVTAWTTLRSAPSTSPVPVAHTSAGPTPTSSGGSLATPAGTGSPGATGSVVVDVAGKVLRPGVATLPAGSRVVDALRHAGGARPGVDLSALNLARVLLDGEQVLVGLPGAAAPGTAPGTAPGPGPPAATKVNLNTATLEQLDGLPGVGPVTAQKILGWRTEHGSFTAVDELLEVDGIGEKTLAELAPHVTLQ